jgi:SNF2 family DNA or RNA helicase
MANAWLDGDWIRVAGLSSSSLMELVDTLPNSRWDRRALNWRCDKTRAAAWRLVRAGVSCDAGVVGLAELFDSHFADLSFDQPPLRKIDLWDHQVAGYQFAMRRDAALLNMYMGLGKSLTAVAVMSNLDCRSVLVVCPTKVRSVWRREMRRWDVTDREVLVLDRESWTVAKKTAEAKRFADVCELTGRRYVVVINYESAMASSFSEWSLSRRWDLVILDESHKIKNPSAKSSMYCHRLRRVAGMRLCLSGTPMTHSPLDVFSQARFLDPGIFGTSWPRFRDRYAVTGPFGADHVVSYRNLDELSAKTALFTFTAGKDVLKNLPPITEDYIECELNPEARRIYDELENELFAKARAGVITATNALVKLLRLQQITGGAVPVDEIDEDTGESTGCRVVQSVGTEKQDMLFELVSNIPPDEPVVVFARFREDLDRIAKVAERLSLTYGEISGRRKDLTSEGTMPDGIKILGVQIQSGGVGIDLTRACYVVYYSVGYSLGDYEQSLNRCHRPGQTRHTFIYHLLISDTIDAVIYRALRRRKDVIEEVIEYLKSGRPADGCAMLAP